MQTLSQQALQHQMGRESSYMIQALIHNSDLLSQSGHEEGRTERGGKKQEGPRHQKSQSCRLPAHPPPSQPWCGDKPQNKPWPSRSGESQVFRSRPSGPQSRWLRAQVYSKSRLRSAQPVSQQGASGIGRFQVPQEILRNRPPGNEQG